MKTTFRLFAAAALAAASFTAALSADVPFAVGYVTKSATNQGWLLINKGAEDAARDANVRLITGGPATHGALEDQINAIARIATQGVKALALAPVDSRGVIPIVRRISAGGVPVIAIDTAVDDDSVKSYVATDNVAAAAAQADWVASQIGDADEVILVNGSLDQSTGRDRRKGFVERLRQLKPNSVVHEVTTAWDLEEARIGVETLLRERPRTKVIANAWDDGTLGAVAALRKLGHTRGSVKIIGFDGAPNALALMRTGWVQADVAQMLYRQGYEGVKTAIAVGRGEAVPRRIDTGHQVVTQANLDRFIQENKLSEFMP